MVEFKIKFEEIEKIKKVRPVSYIGHQNDIDLFFEPISIEIDGVIINAFNDNFIKEHKLEYPYNLFEDYVSSFLNLWLHRIPEILYGKPQQIMFYDSSFVLLFNRIDEKNIKIQFTGGKERDRYFNAAGKDFIIPIDIFIQELIRASKEWINTRVVYATDKEDLLYIAIMQ